MKTKGYQLLAPGSIYNAQIASGAAIDESKLNLTYTTAYLYNDYVSTTRSTTLNAGVTINFAADGFTIIDSASGQKWKLTVQNGVPRWDLV